MKRLVVVACLALLAAAIFTSCGSDNGSGPGDGNGGGEVTVLSAASSSGWTVEDFFVEEKTGADCEYHSYHSTEIGSVWIPGGFSLVTQSQPGLNCCDYERKNCQLTSKKVDLTPYKTARIQGKIRFYNEHYFDGAGVDALIKVYVVSNVPGSPELTVVYRSSVISPAQGETVSEESFDVSLENALTYREASVLIYMGVQGGCVGSYPDYRPNQMSLALQGIRIVGIK